MIPARYSASRFPGKLMQDLGGKTVILRTYEATVATNLFDEVYVVTDSDLIFQEITANGGKAIMSQSKHQSGSDRIAEAIENIQCDIVVNVQGDEPFTERSSLEKLLSVFHNDFQKSIDLASLMVEINDLDDINNPNTVKVIVDQNNFALYFSRSPIPFPRELNFRVKYFKHKGVYAFRKKALLDFTTWPVSHLEATEKLEQLRYLEHGIKIRMVETDYSSVAIDTPEDLERAKVLLANI